MLCARCQLLILTLTAQGNQKKLNTSSGENSHGERQETCDALLYSKALTYKANWTYLEVKTIEQLRDECEGREEDLQGIDICSMSLTQLNSSLQQRREKRKY